MFDNTITMGNVLQIVAMMLCGLYFVWVMEKKISLLALTQTNLAERLSKIDIELQQLTKITVDIARQDERMTAQDTRIQELSNRVEDVYKLTTLLLPAPAGRPRPRRNKD